MKKAAIIRDDEICKVIMLPNATPQYAEFRMICRSISQEDAIEQFKSGVLNNLEKIWGVS